MGILNVTPDSFSGDGIYENIDASVKKGVALVEDGADILDVGGESTRPGAEPVTAEEEIKRVVPVIRELRKLVNVPISIDTYKADVAEEAIKNGASIVNDITGFDGDKRMADVAADFGVKVVLMHIKGNPQTMQIAPYYENLIEEIIQKLKGLVSRAEDKGIKKENIIIDPGFGFGKTFEDNLKILNNLHRFKELHKPILAGVSRKSFIGRILNAEAKDRLYGTSACVSIAINNGADIVRVHDVKEIKQVVMVADAVIRSE